MKSEPYHVPNKPERNRPCRRGLKTGKRIYEQLGLRYLLIK